MEDQDSLYDPRRESSRGLIHTAFAHPDGTKIEFEVTHFLVKDAHTVGLPMAATVGAMDAAFCFMFGHPDCFIQRTRSDGHDLFIKTIGISMADAFLKVINDRILKKGKGTVDEFIMLPWHCSFIVEICHLGKTSASLQILMYDGSRSSHEEATFLGRMWFNLVNVNMAVRRPEPMSDLQRQPFLHLPMKPSFDVNMDPFTVPNDTFVFHKYFSNDHIDVKSLVRWNDHVLTQYQCLIAAKESEGNFPELTNISLKKTTVSDCKMLYVADIQAADVGKPIRYELWGSGNERSYCSVVKGKDEPLAYCTLNVLRDNTSSNL